VELNVLTVGTIEREGCSVGSLIQNLRYGFRLLLKQPALSVMALVVLALGIGANSAMFSLVNAFLFKPLVIKDAGQLAGCYSRSVKRPDTYRSFSYSEYTELRQRNTVFSGLTAHNLALVGMAGAADSDTRRVFADLVSSNYFDTFGVPLYRGRTFTKDEERPGSAIPVAIVSYSHWKKSGGDPDILGKTVRVNGKLFTVVGIAAEGFSGTMALVTYELYLPLGMFETVMNDFEGAARPLADPANHALMLIGRKKPGLSEPAIDSQLALTATQMISGRNAGSSPDAQTFIVRPLARLSVSDAPVSDAPMELSSMLTLCMSGIVLLIASLNVANMMLARGAARRKEIAIRLALGGTARSIRAQLFTEGLLLATLGGAAGLVVSYWSTALLMRSIERIAPLDLGLNYNAAPDQRVLAVTMGLCLLSTVLFSLVPAMNLSRPNLVSDIKSGEQDVFDGGKPRRLWSKRNLLVMGQLALSLMLLCTAGLFIRSSVESLQADTGFRVERNLLVEMDPSLAGYDATRSAAAFRAVLQRVRAIPGVESASLAGTAPFSGFQTSRSIQRFTDPPPSASNAVKSETNCTYRIAGSDYFRTMGIHVLRGREFSEAEMSSKTTLVAILDQRAAETLWPKGDALGRQIRLLPGGGGGGGVGAFAGSTQPPQVAEVVGVVANIRDHFLGTQDQPMLYVPFGQDFQSDSNVHLSLVSGSPEAQAQVAEAVRKEIRTVDSRLPVLTLRSMRQQMEGSMDYWVLATTARMFTVFGAIALFMAAVGLYGVRAYMVTRRTREIGIRMAIGASTGDTLRMILAEGLLVTAIGVGAGLMLSLTLGKVMAGFLYRVSGSDPLVFSLAPLTLAVVSLAACYFPARRAGRVNPMVALRTE
jgi:predicted permease